MQPIKPSLLTAPPGSNSDGGAKGKVFCHRFMIPFAAAFPTGPNPLNPAQMSMQLQTNMGFVDCIKETCNLWDKETGSCIEKRLMKAQAELAEKQLAHFHV